MEPSCFCSFDEDDDDDKDDEDDEDEDEDDDGEEDEDDEDVENYADRGGGDDDALSCLFGCVLGLLKNKHSNEKSLSIRVAELKRQSAGWWFLLLPYHPHPRYTKMKIPMNLHIMSI